MRGGHPGYVMGSSADTCASLRPVLTGAVLGLIGAAVLRLTKGGRDAEFELFPRGRTW